MLLLLKMLTRKLFLFPVAVAAVLVSLTQYESLRATLLYHYELHHMITSRKAYAENLSAPWRTLDERFKPRQFVMDAVDTLEQSHGLRRPASNHSISARIRKRLLCTQRELQASKNDLNATCELERQEEEQTSQVMRCTSYTSFQGHSWYAAVSPTGGGLFGMVNDQRLSLDFVQHVDADFYQQMDFLVPFKLPHAVKDLQENVEREDDPDDVAADKRKARGKQDRDNTNEAAKLLRLVQSIKESVETVRSGERTFGKTVQFRVLITHYPQDLFFSNAKMINALKELAQDGTIKVSIVPCQHDATSGELYRQEAASCLVRKASCRGTNCLISFLDVDLNVQPSFVYNSLTFVHPGTTAYFPIVYSEYNPDTVSLVNSIRQKHEMMDAVMTHQREDAAGTWLPDNHKIWSLSGLDALKLQLNETLFTGWGGHAEEDAYYDLVSRHINVVRLRDAGLTHKWHPVHCDEDLKLVNEDMYNACLDSMFVSEGNSLGVYLKLIQKYKPKKHLQLEVEAKKEPQKKDIVEETIEAEKKEIEDKQKQQVGIKVRPSAKEEEKQQPEEVQSIEQVKTEPEDVETRITQPVTVVEQAAPRKTPLEKAIELMTPEPDDDTHKSIFQVLIIVATCRKNFADRVGTLVRTWASAENLPHRTTVWYYVGDVPNATQPIPEDQDPIMDVAKEVGVASDCVKIMHGIPDDEYPPVRRHVAMLKHAAKVSPGGHGNQKYGWVMKVDDDTYVNPSNLRLLINKLRHQGMDKKYLIWGQHGFGIPGPDREGIARSGLLPGGPFCMGGPGYLMNQRTLQKTTDGIDECVRTIDQSPERASLWHSDVLTGVCVYMATKEFCGANRWVAQKIFVQKPHDVIKSKSHFVRVVTMHPLKKNSPMSNIHKTLVKYQEKNGVLRL